MPTYDYKCKKCGKITSIFHSIKDEKSRFCSDPECDGECVKLVGNPPAHLKGSGFYTTDYPKFDK